MKCSTMTTVFLLLLLLCLCVLVHGKSKQDKVWTAKKKECEKQACSHLVPDEAYNCVYECTSPDCFKEIYGAEPLEDGEIDSVRYRQFTSCLRKEQRMSKVCAYL